MIARTLATKLLALSQKFKVFTVKEPRQSGKTTLVNAAFPALPCVSLEDPDIRLFALNDPHSFLTNYPTGAILDEIQNTPDLFSYLERAVEPKLSMARSLMRITIFKGRYRRIYDRDIAPTDFYPGYI